MNIGSNRMRAMTLEEVHQHEVQVLKDVVKIFEKYHLRYYLAGGTLLGAVRHKGFIPWDDDIDILMPRPDYDRFVTLADEVAACGHYKMACPELHNLHNPMIKIFDLDTSIEKTVSNDELERNLWIDILPMDGLPEDPKKVEKIFRKSIFWRRLLKLKKAKPEHSKTRVKRLFKPFIQLLMTPLSLETIVSKIDKLCHSYEFDACEYIGGIAFGYGPQEKMRKDAYLPAVKLEFEGEQFDAPACWDYYLTALYGDYMKLPPEEEQIAHLMTIMIREGDDKA